LGKTLSAQSIDPSKETFTVYVPAMKPPHGYGLLVFVPPWGEAKMPEAWASVFDQYGVIYVSAANSANDANVLGRRDPLALIEYQNVVDRYPVDPEHVYVGGFSGGSRVAMRLALGYPDVFRGALLDAGADPIGDPKAPLPPRELFQPFQNNSRIVFISGDEDTLNVQTDKASRRSMRDWCVTDTDVEVAPHTAHDTPDTTAFARAFAALTAPEPPDAAQLASCRAGIDAELTSKLQQADALLAGGNRNDARKLLLEIDARFGGLAAPKSVELDAELNSDAAAPH
jgi:pimeloyl-ACP methyl ester carboxylesterase